MSKEIAFRHAAAAMEPTSPVARYMEQIYNNSRINNRYFCVPDLGYTVDEGAGEEGIGAVPATHGGQSRRWRGRAAVTRASRERGASGMPRLLYPSDGR